MKVDPVQESSKENDAATADSRVVDQFVSKVFARFDARADAMHDANRLLDDDDGDNVALKIIKPKGREDRRRTFSDVASKHELPKKNDLM